MRKIVILDAPVTAVDPPTFSVNYAFRLRAPANRIKPRPTATSVVTDATESELAALRDGTYTEVSAAHEGFMEETREEVLEALAADYETKQAEIDALAAPFDFILTSWDGLGWSERV